MPDSNKKYISNKDILNAIKKMSTNSTIDILNDDFETIAKDFLSYLLNDTNIKSINFQELKSIFINQFGYTSQEEIDNLPQEEHEFYEYICSNYLGIEENKNNDINKIFLKVSKDINEIHLLRTKYIKGKKSTKTLRMI